MSTGGWALLLLLVFVASPLIDAWLVRTGRLSVRTASVLLVGRVPLLVALIWPLVGGDLLILVLVEVPLILMAKGLFLPFATQLLTDMAPTTDVGGP